MSVFNPFRRLPYWAQTQILTFAVVAVIGFGLKFNWTVGLFVLGGLVAIAAALSLFFWLLSRARTRRGAAFGNEMGQQNTQVPRGISDPARQARLDDLRRTFNQGLARFQAVGKDFYKLPWYVIAGEPGSGKTQAVRHSEVGFPPGMQNELQGVGGTINMNWWFTNQAVILDTAGRLLFEEVEPGSTNEWREFLSLLAKYRPNCPINGLFLAVPAESLIRDGLAEIERKAGRIARQLEVIQRQFDLRFPVFLIVTKCDLLNGFREFFDGLEDSASKHQLLGWSNPDPLDAPFRPELVDAHIETVLARLRRRRLALLADPVALAGPRASRLDEVDRLYALPQSIALAAPRLRRYLDIIFTVNEWAAKPLFLRGIYFTSSLREGTALDQELAEAIGVPVDDLPDGRAWEQEETYFLRDVFLEKGFRERGLVTRASNTRQLLRKRQGILFGAGFAAVALLLLFSFFAYQSLQRSIARQSGYWLRAAEGWLAADHWQPAVTPGAANLGKAVGPGDGADTQLLFQNADESLTRFHYDLRELAARPLDIGWVFRPLASFGAGINGERRRAQRVVFEGSVVNPLLDGARERMIAGPGPAAVPPGGGGGGEDAALLALVHLESAVARKAPIDADRGERWRKNFLSPLLAYTSPWTADEDDRLLASTASWTYSRVGSSQPWAPEWLSGGASLGANKAIEAGIERLAARGAKAIRDQALRITQLGELADLAKGFRDKENELQGVVRSRDPVPKIDERLLAVSGLRDALAAAQGGTLKEAKVGLDRKVAALGAEPGLYEKEFLLRSSYERGAREIAACAEQVRALLAECEPFAPKPAGTPSRVDTTINQMSTEQAIIARAAADALRSQGGRAELFAGIAEKLRPLLATLETARTTNVPDALVLKLWQDLDADFLKFLGDRRLYTVRWDTYATADGSESRDSRYAEKLDLIGSQWKGLNEVLGRVADLRAQLQAYKEGRRDVLAVIVNYILMRVERTHGAEFARVYTARMKESIRPLTSMPLVQYAPRWLRREELLQAGELARRIDDDLASPVLGSDAMRFNAATAQLRAAAERTAGWRKMARCLVTSANQPAKVTVILAAGSLQRQLSPVNSALPVWPFIQLREGSFNHGASVEGSLGRVPSDSPADVPLNQSAPFEVQSAFHFHFYLQPGGPIDVDMRTSGEEFTAMQLIKGLYDGRPRLQGNEWIVPINVDAEKKPLPAVQHTLWIKLRFSQPPPAFNDWPTRAGLDLDPENP